MAISVTYADFGNWFSAAAQSVTISYDAGDILVVASGLENGSAAGTLVAPTASNVTFDAVGASPSNISDTECACGMWVGEATGSGTSVTIKGATSGQGSGAVWKVQGATLTGKIELGPNTTEAAFNQAVAAGDAVFYAGFDWNAHTGNLTGTTGSGTLTERVDFGNGTTWGGWLGDWVGTAAGTFDFGVTDYSALKVNHAALVLKATAATTTLEQEGFRFYADDGDEDASTALAAQDTDATATLGTLVHYRALIDATGDPAAATFTLYAQKNGAGGYVPVPVGASSSPTIAHGAIGAVGVSASGGATVAPGYPTGITADGSELVLVLGMKPSTANGGTVTTPSGWTLQESLTGAGGYGATLGADTGNTNVYVYTKDDVTGSESGTLTVTVGTNGVCWAYILRAEVTGGPYTISFDADDGSDTSAGNVSITTSNGIDITAGDLIYAGMVIPTDVTTPAQFSAEALAQTGTTFGTVTELAEPDSATGNDIGGFLVAAPVSSGGGTGAVTLTATAGGTTTNVRGPGFVLRLRASSVANELYIATSTNIGGSDATTARLTAPAGKTTGDFVAGVMSDNANPLASVNITTDDYTEVGHVLATQAPATTDDFWDLRYYAGAVALDTYTTTGRLTITAGGGGGATATPAQVVTTTTMPAPAITIAAAPARAITTVAVPTPTVVVAATVAPAAIGATTTVPAPTVAAAALRTPATIATAATIGAPAVSVATAPTTVAATTTVPTPTAGQAGGIPATVTPTAVATVVALGATTEAVGAAPARIVTTAALPAPSALTGSTRSPATIATTSTVPGPTVVTGTGAGPATVAAVLAMPASSEAIGTAPARIVTTSTVPTPTPFTGTGATPATVATVATPRAPAVTIGAAPARIITTTTVPTPTALVATGATPATITATATPRQPAVAIGTAPARVVVLVSVLTPGGGAATGWVWLVSRGGTLRAHTARLSDGTTLHPTAVDVT